MSVPLFQDYATRFYTNAREIKQNFPDWFARYVRIADTPSAAFLIKSGADLFHDLQEVSEEVWFELVIASDNDSTLGSTSFPDA